MHLKAHDHCERVFITPWPKLFKAIFKYASSWPGVLIVMGSWEYANVSDGVPISAKAWKPVGPVAAQDLHADASRLAMSGGHVHAAGRGKCFYFEKRPIELDDSFGNVVRVYQNVRKSKWLLGFRQAIDLKLLCKFDIFSGHTFAVEIKVALVECYPSVYYPFAVRVNDESVKVVAVVNEIKQNLYDLNIATRQSKISFVNLQGHGNLRFCVALGCRLGCKNKRRRPATEASLEQRGIGIAEHIVGDSGSD